jgi:filamentous hemagglutinin
MNKRAYRVIFNRKRRQVVAVAETVSSRGGTESGPAGNAAGKAVAPSDMLFRLAYLGVAIAALFGAVTTVQAQIVADPNAGRQGPVIDHSANGLPVVQIVAPDAAGMSHNQYQQFNVDQRGAILNNAAGAAYTQQGGYIGGNPNLAPGGQARIILNEVTGASPSQLNGYIEVAGQRAQVIVANENGISCSGCGFINTTRGVLTTGRPVFGGNGSLEAFRVTRGDIAIDRLNGGNTDQLDLIARSVQVNGEIWADQLNVVSGANQVAYADLGVQLIAGEGAKPTVGIDVAQLGGMYANKIRLVGTEAGVGVVSLGNIAAQAGDLHIDNQGKITLKGDTSASGALTIHGADDVVNSGAISSRTALRIDSAGDIANSGSLAAQGDLTLNAARTLDNAQSDIQSGQALRIDAANIDNSAGKLVAGTDAAITVQGDYTNNIGDQITANRDLTFSTSGKLTNAGVLDAVRELHLNVDQLDNQHTASVNAASTIIHAAGDIRNTGRIYGDRIAIAAATLTNTLDTPSGQAGVIASRGNADIGAVDIFNLEGAQLYASGDLAMGRTLDGNDRATGVADQIQNQSARIESEGAMQLAANDITNRNNHFQTEQRNVSVADIVEYQLDGHPQRWDASQVRQGNCEPNNFDCLHMPDGTSGQDYTVYRYKRTISQTFITESKPGEILAGGDLAITGNVINDNSRVVVSGALSGALDSLTNNQTPGVAITTDVGTAQHTSTTWRGGFKRKRERVWDDQVAYQPAAIHRDSPMQIAADATVSPGAGKRVTPSLLPDLVLPDNPMFVIHPEPGQNYLIETDPTFTDYKTFLSSDYMLSRMSMDPMSAQKRLGDGYYEQKLINDQIAELTGKRFLGAYASNEVQYQALMDAGIASAGQLQLTPGIALTDAQQAALTQDIVWLVSQDITLPDGSVSKVLAPVVYLAGAGAANVQAGGALISAKSIDVNINGVLNNAGVLQATDNLLIQANDIANSGAIGSDATIGNTVLTATNDLVNKGGKISGNRVGLLAGNDLSISTTTTSNAASVGDANHGSSSSHTLINSVAGIEAGQLDMRAGRDINLDAAQIAVTGDAVIAAGRDLNLNAVNTKTSLDLNADSNNHLRQSQSLAEGTQIQADGAIAMVAGRDIQATAAYVNAGQALTAVADRDIHLNSAQQGSSYDQEIKTTSSGLMASSTKHIRDKQQSTQAVGTTFSGDSVQLAATHDITLAGGNIAGTGDVSLAAGNDIQIATSENTANQSYYKEETTSGLFGTDGGMGVTMGTKAHQNTQTTQQTSRNSSTIGSTDGNVQLVAGNNYTQSGSNVVALAGDVGIAAKSVDIEAVQDVVVQTTKDHTEQSGLTLGVSAPIISAIQSVQQMKSASGKTDDPRMKALAAATAASTAGGAATAAQNPMQGVTISLTVGASKSDSQSRQTTSTAAGSSVQAGGNVVISATGDGKNSHLNVIGSDIAAGRDATLKADGDINLQAAQSGSTQRSRNSSSSAAVGIAATYGENGFAFGITANAAGSRGKADGSDLAHTNTHVTAGNNLTLESGHDTTLAGAVASGKQVTANVGTSGQGDLTIQSLQDTSSYTSKDQHIGGSVTIGYGASGSFSAGQSKVDGDYASVGEQSGIKTGDGGFNVHVNGNTDLAGGVIAGSATADKNSLVTGTLTQSDIENHSRYEASSISIGGGYGEQANADSKVQTFTGGATGTAGGYSSTDGDSSGTSRSGVSAGTIVISDDQAQQQLTGQTADAAIDSINRHVGDGTQSAGSLVKDWDSQQLKGKVNAEAQITAAFGSAAARQIGDYATTEYKAAMARGDKEEAAKWAEGGVYRVALHTGVGALTGGIEGAAGAFASAESMKAIGEAIDQMDLPKGVKQGLAQVLASATGAVVGGGAGAVAAVNVEANNRQLHQSERDFAKQNAKKFAQYYQDKTGQIIDDKRAEQILLGDGYRMTDAAASKGPGVAGPAGDAVAVSFIAQNAGNLFKTTPAEYNNPGKLGGPLTSEQAALPGAVGNPALGLAAAGLVTGGTAFAGAGMGAAIAGAMDAYAAYKAAQASYWMGTALGTGAAVGGASYTGGAVGSAVYDRIFGSGQAISTGFDQRFSYPGLTAATTVGGLTGMYGTAMFGWAGIPNSFTNWATIPGFVIRANSTIAGKAAGSAAQAAVNSSTNR